jgi:MoaA/NifB/PqqE/SkfB family radical SAM enzyme
MGLLQDFLPLIQQRVPGQLIIQLTDRCNAHCPQCGMRVTESFPRSTLSVDTIRPILDKAAEAGVRIVSFTGGEPLLYLTELITLIKHAGSVGIEYIRTGTNGSMFVNSHRDAFRYRINDLAERLAGTPLRNFWVSLDSAVPAVHERMRGFPGVVAGIERAIPILHEHGIYPFANLGINRNMGGSSPPTDRKHPGEAGYLQRFCEETKEALRRFYRHTINLGFTSVNTCYPMSITNHGEEAGLEPVYAANSTAHLVRYSPGEKAMLFRALLETVAEFRGQTCVFSPRSSLLSLYRSYADGSTSGYPCRGGVDFFFIDSQGANVYPCGFRGTENLGDFCALDRAKMDPKASCQRCDWECFRDPSEMFGPILHSLSRPWDFIQKLARDRLYYQTWLDDLRYYHACDLFNERKPPVYARLSAWRTDHKALGRGSPPASCLDPETSLPI